MTKQELNRRVRKLAKKTKELGSVNTEGWTDLDWTSFYENEEENKQELRRLYFSDTTLKDLTPYSLRAVIRMNLRYRAVPLFQFGNYIA
jgi:hypothetical protein